MVQKNLFILAGNGSYDNRGCEAIVRGTTEIIRQHFDVPEFLSISNFQNEDQFKAQVKHECDGAIAHARTFRSNRRFSPGWFLYAALRFSMRRLRVELIYREMLHVLKESRAVLSIGGDNYSLDYGKPLLYTTLDDLVLRRKKPIIIWGASVGPFDGIPGYEKYMSKHLKRVTGIFVRETATLEYLASIGVKENVTLVADPAFLLKIAQPAIVPDIKAESIGINLSPFMAKYLTDGDLSCWVKLSAQIVREVSEATGRKIYLIPHVTSPHTNDYTFLKNVLGLLDDVDVALIDDKYSAAEIKWIISKMAVFAGARTHATIAAISTCVPTLSFVYSIKARGINRDVFGHERFCILKKACRPKLVAEKVQETLAEADGIREQLKSIVPEFQKKALSAGQKLLEVCV